MNVGRWRAGIVAAAILTTCATVTAAARPVQAGLVADVPADIVIDQMRSDVNSSPEAGDRFGSDVVAGDFNGDGITDLAVGAAGEATGSPPVQHGVVQVFYRGADGSLTGAGQLFLRPGDLPSGSNTASLFGASLASGDFDGDGVDDLAIGAPNQVVFSGITPQSAAGVVHVVYGSDNGLVASSGQVFSGLSPGFGGPQAGAYLGYDLASGDFDGDGLDDLAVGEPGRDIGPLEDAGRTAVFFGRTGRFNTSDSERLGGSAAATGMGGRIVTGDFDGDGDDDLVAAPIGVFTLAQRIEVWRSDETVVDRFAPAMIVNGVDIGHSGARLNTGGNGTATGDFDGNGVDDIAIHWLSDGGDHGVAVLLMRPSASGPFAFSVDDFETGDPAVDGATFLGDSIGAGDFDGDGFDDLAMSGGDDRLIVVPGTAGGFARRSSELGTYPSGVERLESLDFNEDGIDDMAIARPSATVDDLGDAGNVVIDLGANERPRTFAPRRLLDTRGTPVFDGQTTDGEPVGEGEIVRVQIADRAGVPAGASGAIVNITIVQPAGPGYATVFPCGNTVPTASTVNYRAGQTRANAAVVALDSEGDLCVFTLQRAHVVVDATGYSAAETAISTRTPVRLLDTRAAGETFDGRYEAEGRRAERSVTRLQVGGRSSVPRARAALLNVTVVAPAERGYVTVWDCEGPIPNASNLNYLPGQTVANGVVTAVGVDDEVCLYTLADIDLVVDFSGAVGPAARLDLDTPQRMIDTRSGGQTVEGRFAGDGRIDAFDIVEVEIAGRGSIPSNTRTAVVNVTAINPAGAGFATLFPCGSEPPTASNVNFVAGATTPNNAIVELSESGSVCFTASTETDVVIDVAGWVD